jgi:hypothetical protein
MPQTCPVPVVRRGLVASPLRRVAVLVCLALCLGVVPGVPAATTWTVCAGGCDYASITAAIAAPTTLDGDTLAIAPGVYTEAGITLTKSLTLRGEAAATTIVQAAASPEAARDRVFIIPHDTEVDVTIRELTIRHGRAKSWGGGGIYIQSDDGRLTLVNSTVSGNATGGLRNEGYLRLLNSTVVGNTDAGGILNLGVLSVESSTLSGNSAGAGGGLANWESAFIVNSTLSGNSAPDGTGGGLFNAFGRLGLANSTVSGNAAGEGGGLYNSFGMVSLSRSIVANHPHGGDCVNRNDGSITSGGYNLDRDGSCQLTAPTDRPGVDPRLGPLQDHGGPTLTHALLPGSPAIDAVPWMDATPWGPVPCISHAPGDQRWRARPQPAGGFCDIGAYEVEVPGPPLSAWVGAIVPRTVRCANLTTGQAVTLSGPGPAWDCAAAGLMVAPGDEVAMRVRGPLKHGVGVSGAVWGLRPSGASCTNLTTGQEVPFVEMQGATAGDCLDVGLDVSGGDHIQLRVQGRAE